MLIRRSLNDQLYSYRISKQRLSGGGLNIPQYYFDHIISDFTIIKGTVKDSEICSPFSVSERENLPMIPTPLSPDTVSCCLDTYCPVVIKLYCQYCLH